VTVGTCGAVYDTSIAVYSGSCNDLTQVASNDDFCGLQSALSFVASAGATYLIQVGGWNGDQGSGDLSVVESEECPNLPPTADAGGPYLVAVNQSVDFDGSASSDPDGDPLTYDWTTDAGSLSGAMPTYTAGSEAGVYIVSLTVNDGTADSAPAETLVVVYDPDGGFVTGGGWIWSEPGDDLDFPDLEGKANFGFVSKYMDNGAQTPTGNTEFQFKAADLNFHSSTYEWLVVNQGGTNAQFRGSGTINGDPSPSGEDYKFMIWATDDADDTFRIRIWWEDGDAEIDVYDCGDTVLGGGNIKVHH
jgi:hypothetical protein